MRTGEARRLFDENASSYDPVNRCLSLGLDRRWRRWAAEQACRAPGARVLEVMAGSAETAVEAARRGADAVAADISPEMLAIARERARRADVRLRTVVTDVTRPGALPGTDFDSVVICFGLRYIDDQALLLRRLGRATKSGGTVVILEFCVPRRGLVSTAAGLYFFGLMPRIGAVLGSGSELYDYLRDSVREIGTAEEIADTVGRAGLQIVERRRMGFGLVVGLVARPSVRVVR